MVTDEHNEQQRRKGEGEEEEEEEGDERRSVRMHLIKRISHSEQRSLQ